jgi:hypothetical protein
MIPATPWQALIAVLAGEVLEDDAGAAPILWGWAFDHLQRDPHPPIGSPLDAFTAWLGRVPDTWAEAGVALRPAPRSPRPQTTPNRPAVLRESRTPIYGSLEAELRAKRGG